jgi:hypothetical protein
MSNAFPVGYSVLKKPCFKVEFGMNLTRLYAYMEMSQQIPVQLLCAIKKIKNSEFNLSVIFNNCPVQFLLQFKRKIY